MATLPQITAVYSAEVIVIDNTQAQFEGFWATSSGPPPASLERIIDLRRSRWWSLRLGPVIHHEDVRQHRLENGDKGLVFRVGGVGGKIFFALEAEEEQVGEVLVPLFRAVVDAPLQHGDFGNLRLEGAEGAFHFLDVFPGGGVLELQADHVTEKFLGLGRFGGRQGRDEKQAAAE